MLGAVEVLERVVQCGSKTARPLGELLRVAAGGYSRLLQRTVVDFGAEESFERAAQRLKFHHRIDLSASSIRKITLQHARRIEHHQQTEGAVGKLPAEGKAVIVAETDGTMLPIVAVGENPKKERRQQRRCQWNEFRLCAARAKGSVETFFGVSQGDVQKAGSRWAHTVREAGWGLNSAIHVVCDGAEWIKKQVQQQFGKEATMVLDFYHVSEYLAAAAKAISQQSTIWRKERQQELRKGKSKRVIGMLEDKQEPPETADIDAPIRSAFRYLKNRPDQLDYAAALKAELPIGSGLIEAGHRHVLQKRLKISGAWWRLENATAMAHLRVLRANRKEEAYWNESSLAA